MAKVTGPWISQNLLRGKNFIDITQNIGQNIVMPNSGLLQNATSSFGANPLNLFKQTRQNVSNNLVLSPWQKNPAAMTVNGLTPNSDISRQVGVMSHLGGNVGTDAFNNNKLFQQ